MLSSSCASPGSVIGTAHVLTSFIIKESISPGYYFAIPIADTISDVEAEFLQLATDPAVLEVSVAVPIAGDLHRNVEAMLRIF
jgi:hypothetical protein